VATPSGEEKEGLGSYESLCHLDACPSKRGLLYARIGKGKAMGEKQHVGNAGDRGILETSWWLCAAFTCRWL